MLFEATFIGYELGTMGYQLLLGDMRRYYDNDRDMT